MTPLKLVPLEDTCRQDAAAMLTSVLATQPTAVLVAFIDQDGHCHIGYSNVSLATLALMARSVQHGVDQELFA